jgi:hypothetical protein
MRLSEKSRRLFLLGAYASVAMIAFSVGLRSGEREGASSDVVPVEVRGMVGATIDCDNPVQTVEQVTGGAPLRVWLRRLLAQEPDLSRISKFMQLVEALRTPEEIQAAFEEANAQAPRTDGMTEVQILMAKFATVAPEAALARASELPVEQRSMIARAALDAWTRLDPKAAAAWARSEGMRVSYVIDCGINQNEAIAEVVSQLCPVDLDAALQAAAGAENTFGSLSEMLSKEILAQRSPEAAREIVAAMTDDRLRWGITSRLAGEWAAKEPQATGAWVLTMPPERERAEILGAVIDHWPVDDLAAARAFVFALPPGEERNAVRHRFAYRLGPEDPPAAIALAAMENDSCLREHMTVQFGVLWMRRDPEAARKWLPASGLGEVWQAHILREGAKPLNAIAQF